MKATDKILPVIAIITVMLVSSCTIQKRKHLKGYHIEWRSLRSDHVKAKRVKKETKEIIVLVVIIIIFIILFDVFIRN